MEIRSHCLTCGGITIDSIKDNMVSASRNELLADLINRSYLNEKRGHGIKMILEREPLTEFEELDTYFVARFRRKSYELPPPAKVLNPHKST